MPTIELNASEQRWLYEHLRSTLASEKVTGLPESQIPIGILRKVALGLRTAFCKECWKPEVYAHQKCEACYRRALRMDQRQRLRLDA